jgi:hypothetical protein
MVKDADKMRTSGSLLYHKENFSQFCYSYGELASPSHRIS